ncbi:dihydroxyacetone kinase subunit DhaL [Dongia sedimenti]|uniref:Dihydroxyacetone kinase subunit DhaL n=1 Tax=Dongia sedimenti TaxID=3064282 RepID=A0ABU0YU06_9PROT|nr:dihydroxyacetone kinase subunit DhaL [Rhodospirillaceae bacterium R-7]
MVALTSEQLKRLIETLANTVIAETERLTALDQAIGDGDHGLNMKRGFEAVLADLDGLSRKPLPDAVKAIGTHLVMKVGGASGPLYGSLFLTLGKELPAEPGLAEFATAFDAAFAAVKARGKSDVGQKTMLDVLGPVRDALAAASPDPLLGDRIKRVATEAAEATVNMKAIRGRASFLGERSIGHMDPGACSSALMISAVIDCLESVKA